MRKPEKQEPSPLVCCLPAGARIKLIGLGGVGCIVLQFLAMFLRSLMRSVRLVLIDGDHFEPQNLQRMNFQ
jgi:molybdopterin/thiamine biosynthesis adenylyltransferase